MNASATLHLPPGCALVLIRCRLEVPGQPAQDHVRLSVQHYGTEIGILSVLGVPAGDPIHTTLVEGATLPAAGQLSIPLA